MREVNLLDTYPRAKRPIKGRVEAKKDPKVQEIAKQFGRDYFDGDRMYGYTGDFYWTITE